MSDAVLFTRHRGDKMLAWLCARKLAEKRLVIQSVV